MPLTDSILNLANTTITITHRTESPRLLGRTQPPTTVVVSAKASVQPTSGRDLQRLPEGKGTQDLISVWTLEPLQLGDVGAGILPDLITYAGSTYEVEHLEPWTNHLGVTYYFGIARKVVS
jgi:hypothetical protein